MNTQKLVRGFISEFYKQFFLFSETPFILQTMDKIWSQVNTLACVLNYGVQLLKIALYQGSIRLGGFPLPEARNTTFSKT